MRRDFRVKIDISRIYQDARQYSWVYIDSAKIYYVKDLADHVRKIFDVRESFHLLSRCEDTFVFLPFEEDIRVLENNDTIVMVPGTGINKDNACVMKNDVDSSSKVQNNSDEVSKSKETDTFSNQSYTTENSSQNNIQNISEFPSFNSTLYRTAMHETAINDTKDSRVSGVNAMEETATEETAMEENSINEESPVSNKRKRVRKRKQKKPTDIIPESDVSINETFGKKPRIIDSILIKSQPAGKHIRFKGVDDEDTVSDSTTYENNIQKSIQNGDVKNKKPINKDLTTLLSLRQSSTPLTFVHKRAKKDYKPESIKEQEISIEAQEMSSKSNTSFETYKSNLEAEKSDMKTPSSRSSLGDDTVSFKVFRIGEDYTPQLSDVIIAKILSTSTDGSSYTLKLLHGKDQLREPEGKFSLPKDEENPNEDEDIITLEKSKLLELSIVKAIDTPK